MWKILWSKSPWNMLKSNKPTWSSKTEPPSLGPKLSSLGPKSFVLPEKSHRRSRAPKPHLWHHSEQAGRTALEPAGRTTPFTRRSNGVEGGMLTWFGGLAVRCYKAAWRCGNHQLHEKESQLFLFPMPISKHTCSMVLPFMLSGSKQL